MRLFIALPRRHNHAMLGRREFVRSALAGTGGLLFAKYSPFASATNASSDSRIEVLLGEPLGTISPNIYGHFAENLSGVIYDGVWVGENSKVPNINGIRKELVDEMRKIKAPVIRFPGGCFADSYDWRDGIGPVDKRPRRTVGAGRGRKRRSSVEQKTSGTQHAAADEFSASD